MPLDRARLSLPCRSEGYCPSRVMALMFHEESLLVSYEYRVFMVHQAKESTFLHLSAEPLRDGVVIEVERPGSELDARSVIVYSVLTHPLDGKPGIAYARESPRLVAAQGLEGDPAGRSGFPTKGASVSMQEHGEEREPQPPPGTTPGEPRRMPDDPSLAPEAPDMPSDPDREPAQSPPDESGSS
jgi:hypothetical protein